jgi:hypothetical protein
MKRKKRTYDETIDFHNAIIDEINGAGGYLTIRHLFYRLVSAGVIPKTDSAYNNVIYHTIQMRKQGNIPYSCFADNTRLMRKSRTYNSPEDALAFWTKNYRRELWARQKNYVEVWSEKDAISNIIFDVTDEYDVPLMIARGFSSLTFLYNASEEIKELNRAGKLVYIYHLGDLDPSGIKASEDIQNKLSGFGCDIIFERLAITREQVEDYNLPTRPTKKSTHSKGFEGESIEIDAMDPIRLQAIVKNAIEQHIDFEALQKLRNEEEVQRETLRKMTLPQSY